jgi:hypothetical protein
MGKSSGSAPAAPDPKVTIQAQSDANADTARLNANLNRVNQVGPNGSITYSQGAAPIDRDKWINDQVAAERSRIDAENAQRTTSNGGFGNAYDPNTMEQLPNSNPNASPLTFDEAAYRSSFDGKATPTAPGQDQWTQTTTLSPEQQRLYDLTTQGQTTYGETANALLKNVQADLSKPVDFKVNTDWNAVRDSAVAGLRSRLDPDFVRQEEALRQRLVNSGLTAGSEGWQREMDQFQRGRNDAYVQADLRGSDMAGQGINQQGALLQQIAALRGMPLNEASALLSGSQVQAPQLNNVPQTQVAPTDVQGAYNTQYQGQLAQYNANQNSNNAALGGLFGLAGTLGGAALGNPWAGGMLGSSLGKVAGAR